MTVVSEEFSRRKVKSMAFLVLFDQCRQTYSVKTQGHMVVGNNYLNQISEIQSGDGSLDAVVYENLIQ